MDLFNDPETPRYYDLLTLMDGITAVLVEAVDIDAGLYRSLRLVVDSARITLAEGITFENGSSSDVLFVPSGSTSGIKVQLTSPIDAVEDEEVIWALVWPARFVG